MLHPKCALVLLAPFLSVSAASVNTSAKLYERVIAPYNRRIRPVTNQSRSIDVYVSFYLLNLLGIVEAQQKIDFNAWVNFTWFDEVRGWDPGDFDGIHLIHPEPLDIWRPRTFVSNSVSKRDLFVDDYSPCTIYSSGLTRWYPGSIFSASCVMDITYFPFDLQSCFIRLLANEYSDEVTLVPRVPFVITGGYIPNGEWELVSSSVVQETPHFGEESFSRLVITMNFKRRPRFYLVNVIVPVIFMSILSSFVFMLPEDSGERASFSITVLLSLSLFMGIVSGQLPKNADTLPVIINYLFTLLLHSGLCVLVSVCQLRWTQLKSSKLPLDETSGCLCSHRQHHAMYSSRVSGESQNYRIEKSELKHCGHSTREQDGLTEIDPRNHANDKTTACVLNETGHCPQREKSIQRLCAACMKLCKSGNGVLFVVFNTAWVVVSLYFLLRLTHRQ